MFNIGGGELMVIALIALIVVGPEQLPGVMRKVGQTVSRLRSMSQGLRDEFMHGMGELDPNNWTDDTGRSGARGSGASDDPIVPRGYANAASGGVTGAEPPTDDPAAGEAADQGDPADEQR